MNTVGIYISLFLILLIFALIAFRISLWLARRSICQVIATFRDYGAVDYQKAMPLELIGLGPRPLFSLRFFRDYKPWALQTLAQAGIIRMATEGNYYLSEETLSANQNFQSVCQAK